MHRQAGVICGVSENELARIKALMADKDRDEAPKSCGRDQIRDNARLRITRAQTLLTRGVHRGALGSRVEP